MSNYRRLISYMYAYEGQVKGKNVGFAKLEVRNGQCKIQVSVKKVYESGNDVGVYLLADEMEILIGKIYIRNGNGEFRTSVRADNVESSGFSMAQVYGLTIHDIKNPWVSYTTIWEDAVTQAAQIDLEHVTSENYQSEELQEEREMRIVQQIEEEVEKQEREKEIAQREDKGREEPLQYTMKRENDFKKENFQKKDFDQNIQFTQELQNAVDSAASALEQAQTSLEDYQAQLEEVTTAYEDAAQVLSNCQYSLNNTDPADDTYGYVYFAQLTTQAQSTADSLEQQKEKLEQKVEQAEENVTTAETAYNKAKRELEQGKLTAAETKKLRTLAYNTAQETYDIALGYLEQDLSDQQETYDETLEKWNEFSTYIDGNAVCARYNGVITSVELEAGDKISTGTSLVTLYDMDEVTMTVTVDEDDMTDISLGSAANIALTAYPEDIFTAKVTVIGDATSDSSGNITYDVTVTLEGDVSGLFQGMTADVTFVTEQTEEVLYVSRRAIITEDDKTYVKVKTAEGSIVKKEITTGLSDGSNVEISGDIAEGDTVLIESSITK